MLSFTNTWARTHGLTHPQAFTGLDVSYKKQECYPSLTHGLEHMGSLTHSQAFTGLDVSYKKQEFCHSLTHGLTHSQFCMGSVLPILLVFVLYFILLICLSSTCVVYAQCCIVHFLYCPYSFSNVYLE
jgi:hypothetical protein